MGEETEIEIEIGLISSNLERGRVPGVPFMIDIHTMYKRYMSFQSAKSVRGSIIA